jgi:hypothetical protein
MLARNVYGVDYSVMWRQFGTCIANAMLTGVARFCQARWGDLLERNIPLSKGQLFEDCPSPDLDRISLLAPGCGYWISTRPVRFATGISSGLASLP